MLWTWHSYKKSFPSSATITRDTILSLLFSFSIFWKYVQMHLKVQIVMCVCYLYTYLLRVIYMYICYYNLKRCMPRKINMLLNIFESIGVSLMTQPTPLSFLNVNAYEQYVLQVKQRNKMRIMWNRKLTSCRLIMIWENKRTINRKTKVIVFLFLSEYLSLLE